jgi:regulator of sigma E protease
VDVNSLLNGFGYGGFTILAAIVAISIIVAIHEYGHYIVGRWCGIHAEVFSLGFGKVLVSRVDQHGTKWQIAAIPFGGYVKFMGDKNAASGIDGETMAGLSPAERRRTMHGAPVWARALTVAAGPVANFLLAIAIASAFVLWSGLATERAVVGKTLAFPFDGPTLQTGDEITAMNGQPIADLTDLLKQAENLPPAASVTYDILRNGEAMKVKGPHILAPIAAGVRPQTAAFSAGIQQGDVVLSVDGQEVHTFSQVREIVGASEGRALPLKVWRNGTIMDMTLTPTVQDVPLTEGGFEKRYLIGIDGNMLFEPEVRSATFAESLEYGAKGVWRMVTGTFSAIAHILRGDISTCNLKGPIGIATTAGATASMGIEDFIWFIAGFSTAVGLMNLLPIPVLDGGHLVFHAYEAIARRPPSERIFEVMMMSGFVLIMGFMAFALSRDLLC